MRVCGVVIISLLLLGAFASPSNAYFEHRYFCAIGASSITVSLQQSGDEKKCFAYIEKVANKIAILQEDIHTAKGLIGAGRDVAYRTEVQLRLQKELDQYASSRKQLIVAVDDFERELFIRVKGIVYVYLNPRYEELTEKIAKSDELLSRTKELGTISQYEFVVEKRDQLYRERLLLDAIRSSASFEAMVFPLKTYFQDTTLTQQ